MGNATNERLTSFDILESDCIFPALRNLNFLVHTYKENRIILRRIIASYNDLSRRDLLRQLGCDSFGKFHALYSYFVSAPTRDYASTVLSNAIASSRTHHENR